jgi:plasmid stabilization system protein ParE
MAQVKYAARIARDLEQLHHFMIEQAGVVVADRAVKEIIEAIDLLERHPQIGRPAEHGLRELVISYGRTGYLALYRFDPAADQVRILALRHQRELDY